MLFAARTCTMGLLFSRLYELFQGFSFSPDCPARILMVGLDAAGKTTILYKVKLNENVSTIPTIGFNVETVSPVKGVTFTVWDVGGQEKIRSLWRYYFQNTEGLLYVVDSSDRDRIEESRDELFAILEDDAMREVPVVVIANKQDLPHAISPAKMVDALELRKLTRQKWHIQGACAVNGDGIYEAMETMGRYVKESKTSKRYY